MSGFVQQTAKLDPEPISWLNHSMKAAVLCVLLLLQAAALRAAGDNDPKPFELTTLLGETFHHCRILKATPEGITVTHDNGVSKISFEILSDEWKKRFHYDPEKAGIFQKEEAARRALAEEKRRELFRKALAPQPSAPTPGRPLQLMDAIADQQVEAAAAAAAAVLCQPGLLPVMPGDPTPLLGVTWAATQSTITTGSGVPIQSTTEVLIPSTTPLTQIYTPGYNGGQRYIINQGTLFTPGDGTIYSDYPYNPYYVNPGYISPGYINPPIMIGAPGMRAGSTVPAAPAAGFRSSTIRIGR